MHFREITTSVSRNTGLCRQSSAEDKRNMNAPADLPQPVANRLIDIVGGSVWAQLFTLIRALMVAPQRWTLIVLPIGSVVVITAIAIGQVRLNDWQGALYDALQQHDFAEFLHQLGVFLIIVSALLALVVAQTWLTEVGKVRLRGWLTRDLLDEWLRPKRAYLFAFAGEIGVNPDQRIHEDARHLSELSVDLGNGLLQSSLLLVSFISVLWMLSSEVVFVWSGSTFSIPGYMVWCAIAYAAIGSWLAWLVGRPLIALNAERYAYEAEFRVALVRVVERAEAIVLYQGEADERASLDQKFDAAQSVTRKIAGGLARLTWITSGHGWLAIIAPFVIASPGYFGGKLSLGSLMITVGAFNQVQSSLRWFVDNFSRIADWRATLLRVVTMREALRAINRLHETEDRITFSEHEAENIVLDHVEAYLPGSLVERATLEEAHVTLKPGEHVLVAGEVAAGKTTFFLALAGLWPWGSGTISLPPRGDMMFLPQRPYLPTGTLRKAIAYPADVAAFKEEDLRAALKRVGLGHMGGELDQEAAWDKFLSLDEQQLLGFARVLLHAPKWVFLDDALGALDPVKRQELIAVFDHELAGTAVISTGRNPVNHFYTRTLHLRRFARRERAPTA
jgi:putative ATP-binding cassette transporter